MGGQRFQDISENVAGSLTTTNSPATQRMIEDIGIKVHNRADREIQYHFFYLSHMFSNVKLSFKMGLFSSIFRSEDSLLCKIALFVLVTFTF